MNVGFQEIIQNSFVNEVKGVPYRGEFCNALKIIAVAFEIRVKSEFRFLNEFCANLITSLVLMFIYSINKFIVDAGSLPGCDAVSLSQYFLPRRSIALASSSGSSSPVRLR
jgi:hypothetical protein